MMYIIYRFYGTTVKLLNINYGSMIGFNVNMRVFLTTLCLSIIFLLSGCNPQPVPAPNTSTAFSTETKEPTYTSDSTMDIHSLSTETLAKTQTSTITPSPTNTQQPPPTRPQIIYTPLASTPTSHPLSISRSNINKLTQIARLGKGQAHGVAWSPDGKTIAVTGSFGLDFYEAKTLTLTRTLDLRGDQIMFNPEGDTVAVSVYGGIDILDFRTGITQRKFSSKIALMREIAFSPDGQLLAAVGLPATGLGDPDFLLEVWRVSSGEQLYSHRDHGGAAGIAFSTDGKKLAIGNPTGVVILNSITGELVNTIEAETYNVAFLPDGSLIARKNFQTIGIYNLETGQELKRINIDGYQEFKLSPDGKILIDEGDIARLWNIDNGQLIYTLDHQSMYNRIAFSPESDMLASVDNDSVLRVWDIKNNNLLNSIEYTSGAFDIAFKPFISGTRDQPYLLAAGYDSGQVWLWDVSNQAVLRRYEGHRSRINQVSFSPDGKTLVSSSNDRTARIWTTDSDQLLVTIECSGSSMQNAVFRSDGQQLLTECGDLIQLWDTATWSNLQKRSGLYDAKFWQDGRLIANDPDEGWLIFVDVLSNETFLSWSVPKDVIGPGTTTTCIEFSPDGRFAAEGTEMGIINIWSIESQQFAATLSGHKPSFFDGGAAGIEDLAFSPYGDLLASAGYDGTVVLWDVETWTLLRVLDDPDGSVESVTFSPDGRLLAAGVYDGTIRVWSVESP